MVAAAPVRSTGGDPGSAVLVLVLLLVMLAIPVAITVFDKPSVARDWIATRLLRWMVRALIALTFILILHAQFGAAANAALLGLVLDELERRAEVKRFTRLLR